MEEEGYRISSSLQRTAQNRGLIQVISAGESTSFIPVSHRFAESLFTPFS
jgi:hypothetical protein